MKVKAILSVILILSFSFAARAAGIDFWLSNLERGVATSNQTLIAQSLQKIEGLKQKTSVEHIPEINLLLEKNIESVPKSEVASTRKAFFIADSISMASLSVVILLSMAGGLFFIDSVRVLTSAKPFAALAFIAFCLLAALTKSPYLVGIAGGLSAGGLLTIRRKRFFGILLLVFSAVFAVSFSAETFLLSRTNSQRFLLIEKNKRDGYSPFFLIASLPEEQQKYEAMATRTAVGNYSQDYASLIDSASDPKLKAVALNNYGVKLFSEKRYKEALTKFLNASQIVSHPKIYYNLFLTYNALLEPDKAVSLTKFFENKVDILKTVPIALHVTDIYTSAQSGKIILSHIFVFFASILAGAILSMLIPNVPIVFYNSAYRFVPIYTAIHNERKTKVVLYSIILFLAVFALGMTIWL